MSPNPNMNPDPAYTPVAPAPDPAAAPAAPAAPEAPKDYQSLYQQEVQERIKERERYKPFAQTYGALDQASQQAILALAQAAAEGDTDAIAAWSASTYRNLTGAEIAAQVAAAQTAPAGAPAPSPIAPAADDKPQGPAGMTPEQVEQMVQQITRREAIVQQISSELAAAGHTPTSPAGRTIIAYAQQTQLPIADAVAWYNADITAQYARMVAGGQQVAAATPPPAPAGAPATAAPNATPAQRALARLQGGNVG